jgi:small subunit ribosomal protein S15
MARIYSRTRGKSGSKKPPVKKVHDWEPLKKKEVETLIVELAKQRNSSATIGILLRDKYGIPDVKTATGKSVSQIMKENSVYPEMPEDMMSLLRKAVRIREHLDQNKADKHTKRGLGNLESRIRRLGKYYVRKGDLPEGWKYSPEEAKLIVQK